LKALHPARKGELVLGLDEQVNMRALQADVHDPDALAQASGDRRVAHGLVQCSSPHVADGCHDAQHDVQCLIRPDLRTRLMRRPGTCALRLAPCSFALTAASK